MTLGPCVLLQLAHPLMNFRTGRLHLWRINKKEPVCLRFPFPWEWFDIIGCFNGHIVARDSNYDEPYKMEIFYSNIEAWLPAPDPPNDSKFIVQQSAIIGQKDHTIHICSISLMNDNTIKWGEHVSHNSGDLWTIPKIFVEDDVFGFSRQCFDVSSGSGNNGPIRTFSRIVFARPISTPHIFLSSREHNEGRSSTLSFLLVNIQSRMENTSSTLTIPVHGSFHHLLVPTHFYDKLKRELSPNLLFLDQCGHQFVLNIRMHPWVGLIYNGYKEILTHHNITGGALILATYEGNSRFRFKIVHCNENDFIPFMVNNCTSYPQNLKVIPVPYGSLDQHSSQLNQLLLGIPIVTTTKLTNVETKVQNFITQTPASKNIKLLKAPTSYNKNVTGKLTQRDNLPPSRRLRLPHELNLPRQLLEVAFAHKPKYITVIDDNSRLFYIRLRTKHNNRKTTVLGKGFKEYIIANNLRKGNVITMSFNPNYPDQLHCAVVAEA
ncbi:hypothetical protein PIB30_088345 [Stylosanthes scabra]|uniref:TF-B3 domain-containing protein n=1 Tax=Stylosanthes scabra TaxID=79078 RepID=A0ABU6UT65_9FABA|nr:hypothetical protein [Stylosanthes scabra]